MFHKRLLNKLSKITTVGIWFKKRPLVLPLVLVFFLVIGIGCYIAQINTIATQGVSFRDLEQQLSDLKQEHYAYLAEEAELRSMKRLEWGIKALEMSQIDDKDYVDTSTAFALR